MEVAKGIKSSLSSSCKHCHVFLINALIRKKKGPLAIHVILEAPIVVALEYLEVVRATIDRDCDKEGKD